MAPLPSPPTMSITEEIMQFINQNCVREGMAELSSDVFKPRSEALDVQSTEPQDQDEHQYPQVIEEEDDQQTIIPSIPEAEQAPLDVILDNEDSNGHSPLSLSAELPSEISLCSSPQVSKHTYEMEETILTECPSSESSESVVVIETAMPEEAEGQIVEDNISKDELSQARHNKEQAITETSAEPVSFCDHPSTTRPVENLQAPKMEAEQKLTKSDRQIIEKIRSYYEAAESEAVVEDGQTTRRNSFSDIPTGLVKDSVSRFNVFVHQVSLCDSESGRSDCNENDITSLPPSVPDPNQKIVYQPDSAAASCAVPQSSQEQSQSDSKYDDDDNEQICDFKPCMELWKEKERKAESLKVKEGSPAKVKEACAIDQPSIKDMRTHVLHEQDHEDIIEPISPKEATKTDKILQSYAGTKDKISSNGNLDGLPSQIKVGRFSRHSKVVTCSSTFYEGMTDVPGLGFFEGGPVDQCLVENSEKILSKVQMLARMYTAKASSMKVPLHQKRTRGTWVVPNKVNAPAKSQLQLHQAEVKTQNQLSDVHIESVVPSPAEAFGHVIVREQFSTTYHQENDCNLNGQKEQEEKLAIDLGSDVVSHSSSERSLQKHEDQAMLHKEDEATSPPPCSLSQEQVASETFDHCEFVLEQKTNHTLYSITEDHSVAVEKLMCVNEDRPHRQLSSADQCLIEPTAAQCLKETNSAREKGFEPAESKPLTEEKVGEIQLQASENSIECPVSCPEDCTPRVSQSPVSSIDVIETSLSVASELNFNNSISESARRSEPQTSIDMSISEVSEQSVSTQLQSQPSSPPGMHNPEPLNDKEVLKNGLSVLSPLASPPPCGPTADNLPKFTSQRPDNLPTAMGRRSLPANWNTSTPTSSQRLPQTQPWSREQDQNTSSSASLVSSNMPPLSNKSSGITSSSACSSETKRPSAFSSSLRMRSPSPIRSSPQLSSSALAKSLAASCISQTISQSMAKRNARLQATSPTSSTTPSLTSALRLRSPSPKAVTLDACVPLDTGSTAPAGQIPKCPPSPFRSNSLRSSPATVHSPPPYQSHRSTSPPVNFHSAPSTHTRSDNIEQSHHTSFNGNNNNNNNSLCSNGWASNHKNTSSNMSGAPHPHDPHRGASHNRITRPFLSSEPNSRVQSPSPSPTPSLFTRICSPPLVQSNTNTLITKPPNPRTPRQGGASPFAPLCLEFSRTASACSLSPCPSPRITSPPPIGIPTNVWCIASPQPRNPSTVTPSSPTRAEASSASRGSRITSPLSGVSHSSSSCSSSSFQNQRRPRGSSVPFVSLASRPPSPSRNFAENGRWSIDLEIDTTSPRGMSYNGTPVCVSPGPQSPVRLTVGKTDHGGKHLTSIAWPDVHELLTKYNTEDDSEGTMVPSSPCPETGLEDSELGQATCRSSLICAYVARTTPVPERHTPSQCSEEGKKEDDLSTQGTKTLKTSYATTVNLQIAGSGRITSFSNAQVSLTQTLAPVTDTQGVRRVSVNGCNLALQNCKRL
ncbi:uncharacterized protein [Salminus brasiliensis]|uniref:uncharacterized protein n=1 Tax=Salminus brasiliensis TaxID=930266 RepID=UPI003B837857